MTNLQAIDLLKGLEQSLDDYCELNDEGKTAFRMAITALEVFGISEQLPSAQPDVLETNVGDMISRQAAIDALKNRWKKTRNYEGIGDDIAEECELYLKQVPSAQPEQCKDAVSKAKVLEAYADLYDVFDDNKGIQHELHKVFDRINNLPSAQPEIIRCKDCEHYDDGLCRRWKYSHVTSEDSFCSGAERREE